MGKVLLKERDMTDTGSASIGMVGKPYYDKDNDRVKALIQILHTNIRQVMATLLEIIRFSIQGTRISARVFVSPGVDVQELKNLKVSYKGITLELEAIVPVHTKGVAYLAYYGWNHESRLAQTMPNLIYVQDRLLKSITSRSPNGNCKPMDEFSRHLHVKRSMAFSDQDIQTICTLYKRTFNGYLVELTPDTITDMVRQNHVALVRNSSGTIVAIGMAEFATLMVGNQAIILTEMSEMATDPEYHGKGFCTTLFRILMDSAREHGADIIYNESRANHGAILKVGWDTGFIPCGTMLLHCIISSKFQDVKQLSPYGDLVVMALPPTR